METIDPQMAARVWQRVRPGEEPPVAETAPAPLAALIAREYQLAEIFRELSARFPGHQEALLRLHRRCRGRAACLRGIALLREEEIPPAPPQRLEERPLAAILGRCYGRSLEGLTEYSSRVSDREYGGVFQCLAQQLREQCQAILELLGELCRR